MKYELILVLIVSQGVVNRCPCRCPSFWNVHFFAVAVILLFEISFYIRVIFNRTGRRQSSKPHYKALRFLPFSMFSCQTCRINTVGWFANEERWVRRSFVIAAWILLEIQTNGGVSEECQVDYSKFFSDLYHKPYTYIRLYATVYHQVGGGYSVNSRTNW